MLEKLQFFGTVAMLLIVLVGIPLYYIVNNKWAELRTYALKLFGIAEESIQGDKVGQERFKYVLETLYNTLVPKMMQRLITVNMVEERLQKWYDEIKVLLEYVPPAPPIAGANDTVTTGTEAQDASITNDNSVVKIDEKS